jgi:hypothetical protein
VSAAPQRAPDLEALIGQLYAAMADGDFAALERIISRRTEFLVIGTDPEEWWEDGARFSASMRQRMQALGTGIPVRASRPRAYAAGDVGWAADRACYLLPGGSERPFRASFVFYREEGSWRVLQWHVSFAVRNEDALPGERTPAGEGRLPGHGPDQATPDPAPGSLDPRG